METYPQSRLLRANAYLAVAAWPLLALAAGLLLLTAAFGLPLRNLIIAGTAFALIVLIQVGVALVHKCPRCGKHPTIQGFAPLHPDIEPDFLRMALDVIKRREFACIHCGTRYRVSSGA